MNDAHRAELVLLPLMMKDAYVATTVEETRDKDLIQKLDDAIIAPVDDLHKGKRDQIVRRAFRVRKDVLDAFPDPKLLGLTTYYFMLALTENQYLEIGEESAMWKALTPWLEHVSEFTTDAHMDGAADHLAGPLAKYLRSCKMFVRFNAL